jgi:hypothetical protein
MGRTQVRCLLGIALLFVLLAAAGRLEAATNPGPPDSPQGIYHGFFQSSTTPGSWGLVEFAITEVRNRRWTGMVTMIFPAGASEVRLPFSVDGTLAANDASGVGETNGNDGLLSLGGMNFNGVGRGLGCSFVEFHGRINFFRGGAAFADSKYLFVPPSPVAPVGEPCPEPGAGSPDRGSSTLLRDFRVDPDMPPPNVGGHWDGTYSSAGAGGNGIFTLEVRQSCAAADVIGDVAPTLSPSFLGTEIIDGNVDNPFFFRGSIGAGNMFAVIAWSPRGDRFVVTGGYVAPPDPDRPATATGNYALLFADGTLDRGGLTFVQQLAPPDPCRSEPIGLH